MEIICRIVLYRTSMVKVFFRFNSQKFAMSIIWFRERKFGEVFDT